MVDRDRAVPHDHAAERDPAVCCGADPGAFPGGDVDAPVAAPTARRGEATHDIAGDRE
ncbi:MAG: hypothetical protein ABFS21_01505 [Actinomycetota bacterium]